MGQHQSKREEMMDGTWCLTDNFIYFRLGMYFGKVEFTKKKVYVKHCTTVDEYMLFCNKQYAIYGSVKQIEHVCHEYKNMDRFRDKILKFFDNRTIIST